MSNPLMRVMLNTELIRLKSSMDTTNVQRELNSPLNETSFNSTINKLSINAQVHDKNDSPPNLREEQERLLKQILAKNKSKISFSEDNNIDDKGIKLITLEELQRDYQRIEPAEEKNEIDKTRKNLVSLASIGKLYREV